MELYILRGTPAEVLEVQKGLEFAPPSASPATPALPQQASHSSSVTPARDKWCSAEVAHRMLTRIGLSPEQITVLQRLYRAGDSWTSATDLQTATGYSTGQFAGLMGAFGRRFTHTPGYVEGTWFFDQEWDHGLACNRYRLPPTVREALESAKVV